MIALAALTLATGCQETPSAPGGSAARPTATGSPGAEQGAALKPGDAAPDITFTLHDGKEVKLSSLKGKQVLVYFYPKDDTPGCTIQAKGLRDGWADLQAAGVETYGVSTQDAQSHQAFIEKYELPFPLVVDQDGRVARAFRVPLRSDLATRQSFLIGEDGTIKQVWLEVDPKEHAAAILAAAKS
ncbi:bacterioferritin comigratory protein [Sorangium cellulosum]|uniref:thioredoxin-dependent peroxiredoxin n=2 Tax=Sorangium cellulosum TaxID=56 RepID=A0A2L0F6X5_SORCE|nr:bacterioferritin comigratory protein [Sorangium cellulosum]